ncbi:MAG: hypothetical protein EPN88_18040 [Bacteroidetes bacterium]|nr:MAG: hypothetical protein EPN88_18040 [Bacteroidota bacterium]
MKNLVKLNINSGKIMKNEELLVLKGGLIPGDPCTCLCWDHDLRPPNPDPKPVGYLLSVSGNCTPDCRYAFSMEWAWGFCVSS